MHSLTLAKRLASGAILAVCVAATAQAQTPAATFSHFNDAVAGRCYNPVTTMPDAVNPNQLNIGMHPCTASSPNGTRVLMDTLSFYVEAPTGFFISKITFTQTMHTSGSRGGRGFAGANWVVDRDALRGPGSKNLSLERKTILPVSITTFLAAFGIQVVSGSASASNPAVVVELLPL